MEGQGCADAVTLVRVAGTAWGDWLRDQLAERGWKPADLIRRSKGEINSSQTTRWLKDGMGPSFESVRAVCGALGQPVVQGLLAADLLAPEDVGVTVIERPRRLEEIHHRELLGEIARRLEALVPESTNVDGGERADQQDSRATSDPPRLGRRIEGEQIAARRRDRR